MAVEHLSERGDDAALVGARDEQRGGRRFRSRARRPRYRNWGKKRPREQAPVDRLPSERLRHPHSRGGGAGNLRPLCRDLKIRLVALGRRHLTRRSTALVHRITSVSAWGTSSGAQTPPPDRFPRWSPLPPLTPTASVAQWSKPKCNRPHSKAAWLRKVSASIGCKTPAQQKQQRKHERRSTGRTASMRMRPSGLPRRSRTPNVVLTDRWMADEVGAART